MDLITGRKIFLTSFPPLLSPTSFPPPHRHTFYFPLCPSHSPYCRLTPLICHAKKKKSLAQPLLEEQMESATEETEEIEEDEEFIEDFGDELSMEDNGDFEDDFEEEDANLYVGDGGAGGGILLADTWWDKEALSIAEEVSMSFEDLKIYAFKTNANSNIRVRIEKLSNKYGSPNMTDIGDFSSAYRARLDEAIIAGRIPENISLEVSSPGVERVVRVPDELERFKEKPMYVRYTISDSDTAADSPQETDGVFRLISFDLEACNCTWGIADVKANRNQAGKGRPLNKKQREWRLETPFDSLRLVRVHSDC